MKKVKEICKAEHALRDELNRKPTREEISQHLHRDIEKIDRVLQHGVHEVSLDEPIGEEQETPLADRIMDREKPSIEQGMLAREMVHGVAEAFEYLNHQQRTVISYRFGLSRHETLTLQETGDGLTFVRIRRSP